MQRKVGLLRGINVGGKRKIRMADLKAMCEKIGLKNVQTYIQSGNLIFNSNRKNAELENALEKAIAEKFGYDVPVIVRRENELENSISNNPFIEKTAELKRLHLTFLKEEPILENLEKTRTYNYEPDQFKIEDKEVFIYCAGKYHESKLTNNFFEKQLKDGATTRHWRPVLKLSELCKKE